MASDVFAIAWAKRAGGVDTNMSWLLKAARNLIGNEYQRRDRERPRSAEMEELTEMGSGEEDLVWLEVRAAMARLRPADAFVLQLTYWDGLSAREAARYLECSTGALWVRLTRARAALRRELQDPAQAASPITMLQDGESHG